ncbi:MAG: CHAT domain-containing protein [Gammaproteobacteria bacterium]
MSRYVSMHCAIVCSIFFAVPVFAQTQIIRDGTVGNPDLGLQPMLDAAGVVEIDEALGNRPGNGENLFHSFSVFDLANGNSALFTADPAKTTRNVISRVTGGQASTIDGTIASSIDGADVYLLNPRGLIFGPNARLDVLASFYASTAQSVSMLESDPDGALTFTDEPSLAFASPLAFGFLGEPATIRITGSRLEVGKGQALSLSAGSIDIDAGELIAGGPVDMTAAERIRLGPETRVTTSTSGNKAAGDITLTAGAEIFVDDAEVNSFTVGAGRAGSIELTAGIIEIENGARIQSTSGEPTIGGGGAGSGGGGSGGGDGGSGGGDGGSGGGGGGSGGGDGGSGGGDGGSGGGDGGSGGGDGGSGGGDGGSGGGDGGSGNNPDDSDAYGDGGNVRIVATERLTTRRNVNIGANSNAGGDAGDVFLSAPTIELLDGSRIASAAASVGDGGNIVIDGPDRVVLAGTNNPGDPQRDRGTRVTASSAFTASGDAGSITIETATLTLDDGARIASGTSGVGQGGSIRIVATESVELTGARGDGSGTTIRATTDIEEEEADALTQARNGDAGSIFISTPALILNSGTEIASNTALPGRGGEISLDVGELTMNQAKIRATSVGDGSGDAGNVRIGLAPGAASSDGPRTLATLANEDAGYPLQDITLTGSTIETSAEDAGGGDIVINGRGSLLIQEQSGVDASDTGGEGGNVFVTMGESIVVIDESRLLARAAVSGGDGGVIELSTEVFIKSNDSDVIAENRVLINRLEKNLEADVAALPAEFIDAQDMFRASCAATSGSDARSSFTVYRRSGLPISPEYALIAFAVPDGSAGNGEAVMAFNRGRYADAERGWSAIAARAAGGAKRSDALRGLGQSLQAQGKFAESLEPLGESLALARELDDTSRIAATLGDLGNAFLALDQREAADRHFTQSLALPADAQQPEGRAAVLINYGNLVATGDEPNGALEIYARAARKAGQRDARALALVNEARVTAVDGQAAQAFSLAREAAALLVAEADTHSRLLALIHLAITDLTIATRDEALYEQALLSAHAGLLQARDLATDLGDDRSLSLALGYLGNLYFVENRLAEALQLTNEAIDAAERGTAEDVVFRWHRLQGQLFWATGNAGDAVAAYGRAITSLDNTRQEALPLYGASRRRFSDDVAPLYMEYVDALIKSSGRLDDQSSRSELLADARSVVERLKEAEIRDYFRDECVTELEAEAVSLDQIAADTAIVYPILLEDRLELLVSIGGVIESHRVDVDKVTLSALTNELRRKLENRTTYEFLPDAQQLYRYLVAPYADRLEQNNLSTVVFVPDGILRTVPMAALHDGQRFLIEKYAIGMTPGLSLVAPRPIASDDARILLAGVSSSQGDFPALPFVPDELRGIQDTIGGKLMLNEQFSSAEFGRYLTETQPSVVHVASHAIFTGSPESSFVLTYDGQLTMDNLHDIVAESRFREPLELLTLSACETAAGDERAALGLSGAAIRAGARSALGTLWTVSDEASQEIIVDFYVELTQANVGKAVALRNAQQRMIRDPRFRHPFYWSAFILISNWL